MESKYNSVNRAVNERDVTFILNRYGLSVTCLDSTIFQNSFVHRTYRGHNSIEVPDGCMPLQMADYERLQNLGDSGAHLVVSDYLHERYPDESEAFISQLRMKIVSGAVLSNLSFAVGVPRFVLMLAQAEADRARERPCVAEDVFEAFVAAIFRTYGYSGAKAWMVGVIQEHLDISNLIFSLRCSKDRLVRFCVDRLGYKPKIKTTSLAKGWMCMVYDNDDVQIASGSSDTSRQAELKACQLAWETLCKNY